MRRGRSLLAALALGLAAVGCAAPIEVVDVDTWILNGEVHAGDGDPGRVDAVALSDDRVVYVGPPPAHPEARLAVIDASGLVVAPGFIDPHTHAGDDLRSDDPARRVNANYLMQGVTTIFIGNDGGGSADVADAFAAMESAGVGPNVAAFVGFGAVRRNVMGDANRAPTADELDAMTARVASAMCQGAFGLSSGLYYTPQAYATTDEVVALATEAGARGGVYETHLRDESSYSIGLLASVDEAIEIGRRAGAPTHFAHLKALGVDVWGRSADVIARIEDARASGHQVTADQYPWRASGTHIGNALLPAWVRADSVEAQNARLVDPALADRLRQEMTENLRIRGGPAALLFTGGGEDIRGKTLAQVAQENGRDPLEVAVEIIRRGDAPVGSFNMNPDDIRAFMVQPWMMTGSDGSTGHPRKYNTHARKYAIHVREENLLTREAFIRGATSLVADSFDIPERGRLVPGAYADVVVFDPERYDGTADFDDPESLAVGVAHVFVNGVPAVRDGAPTGALAGRPVRHPLPPDAACPP